MHALSEKPFGLKHGDLIVVRISSMNLNGLSVPSAVSTDKVAFVGLPQPMTAPAFSNELDTEFTLTWVPDKEAFKALKAVKDNKGSIPYVYEIFWDTPKFASDGSAITGFVKLAETENINYVV